MAIWLAPGSAASDTLPGKSALSWLQVASRAFPRRYKPIPFLKTPAAMLRACRSDPSLAPACATRMPRVALTTYERWGRTYSSLRTYQAKDGGVFGMQVGGEIPGKPELMRPPGNLHIEVEAATGRAPRTIGYTWPTSGAVTPRDGLVREKRDKPVLFGSVTWGGKKGTLVLSTGYPTGGSQGGHVVFRWRSGKTTYLVGMHAWEPLTEAVATLRRVVASLPR